MKIDLNTWIDEKDYQSKILRNISNFLLLDDHKHLLTFYGNVSAMGILRSRMLLNNGQNGKGRTARVIIPYEVGEIVSFCKTEEDLRVTGLFNVRYSNRLVQDLIIGCFSETLTTKEYSTYLKGRLDLSKALHHKTESRIELVKRKFDNLKVIVFNYANETIDDSYNSVGIVTHPEDLPGKIHVSGMGPLQEMEYSLFL